MRLGRRPGLKTVVLTASAGLFAALFGLIRSESRVGVEAEADQPAAAPSPDYDAFFAPRSGSATAPQTGSAAPAERPHTRTRAS